jgi:outer membrane protein TolC
MSLNARFGLSQTAPSFGAVYSDLLDQEVVGLSFSIPIFDWGLGKGKVQKAKAAQEVVRAQIQQSENDYRRKIFTLVGQFNNQRNQCSVSKRAMLIAQERYELMMEKFRSGKASVMELNTAQSENDTVLQKYITYVSNFWKYYYTLRQFSLYDFIKGQNLDVDVNEMIVR